MQRIGHAPHTKRDKIQLFQFHIVDILYLFVLAAEVIERPSGVTLLLAGNGRRILRGKGTNYFIQYKFFFTRRGGWVFGLRPI